MLVPAIVLSLSLFAPVLTTPDAPTAEATTIQKTASSRDDREWAVQRPSRGVHARVVAEAARVPAGLRGWANCVARRESGGNVDRIQSGVGASNPASSAQGKFQFLDRSWRRGLAYMVADRLVDYGMPRRDARKVRIWLQAHPIREWNGYYQQAGFLEVVQRGGKHHWNGGSHSC